MNHWLLQCKKDCIKCDFIDLESSTQIVRYTSFLVKIFVSIFLSNALSTERALSGIQIWQIHLALAKPYDLKEREKHNSH